MSAGPNDNRKVRRVFLGGPLFVLARSSSCDNMIKLSQLPLSSLTVKDKKKETKHLDL